METWSAYAFSIHLEEFRFENKGGGGGEWRTKKLLSYFLGRTFWSEMKCGYSFLLFAFLFFSFFFPPDWKDIRGSFLGIMKRGEKE